MFIKKIKNIKKNFLYIKNILNYNKLKQNLKKINKKIKIKTKKNIYCYKLNKKYFFIKKNLELIKKIEIKIKNIKNLKKYKKNFYLELNNIFFLLNKIKNKFFLFDKYDKNNCYINIQSGSGGIDAQDWSNIILKMYIKWLEKKKYKFFILEKIPGEIAGIKSALLFIEGKYSYGLLKNETGIHRLIRKSPFKNNKKRQTSFSSVYIYPHKKNKFKNLKLNINELKIDVYKSSGTGGQYVNKTESAVRITHIPTGLIAKCQENRSQHKNKEKALKQLKYKLFKFYENKKIEKKNIINKKKNKIKWGNQIRSYFLDKSIVKDIKSKIEIYNINSVLNGNIDLFIEKILEINYKKKYEK